MSRIIRAILRCDFCSMVVALVGMTAAADAAAIQQTSAGPYARAGVLRARILGPGGEALPDGVTRFAAESFESSMDGRAGLRYLTFQTIAEIYPISCARTASGDTDHDLKNEIVMYVNDTYTHHYRILENRESNIYTEEYSGDELIPYGVGDFDRDGLADLVGQCADRIVVYEALHANSYPTRLAWTSPLLMNVKCFLRVADTDQDGRDEFLYSYNPFSGMAKFYIFENTGPDTYTQV